MNVDNYGEWWFCATEEEGYYVAGSGDKELTNLITREQAQLIASAPYLLEALKQALEECIWPNERLSDVYDKARKAIKKAEA
jgi:hypothetical protein